MSQLDNKKASTAKKTFLMLLIFTIICAGITVALIHNTLVLRKEVDDNEKKSVIDQNTVSSAINEKEEIPIKESTVEKVKLTDKYFTNGIVTEEIKMSLGDIIYQYENNIQRKLEISYVQISGLKDTSIQDKINKEIEKQVLSLRNDDELLQEDIERIGIYAYVSGNFSDVISIALSKDIARNINGEYKYDYQYIGLNYSLKDGEIIKFTDLFTEDAAIKNIITQSVYDSLAWNYAEESGNLDADMSELDYSDIEDKVFKILSIYRQNPDLTFYFNQSRIYFIVDNVNYSIAMADFYDSIAIYTRYKSKENLYEDESLVKSTNYVFSITDMSEFIVDTDNKTDNFYYRIIKNMSSDTQNEEIENVEKNVQDLIYKKINDYAILANKNKEKGYVLDIVYYISEYNGKISYNYDGILCSMDRNYFNKNLEELLASSMRKEMVELWCMDYSYIDPENVTFEEQGTLYVEDYTNPIETEQIITREDV